METHQLLAELKKQDVDFIHQHGKIVRAPKGTVLFRDGDPCQNFVLVERGSICVQKTNENGRQLTLYHVKQDNLCILTSACLIGDAQYNAEGIAETDLEALVLPKENFKSLMEKSPEFRQLVFSSLAGRITSLIQKIDEISFTKISLRLAQLLWNSKDSSLTIKASHQSLADELGTAREVISRQLKTFEKLHWIKTERQLVHILVPDFIEKVRNLVDGD